MLTNCEDHEDFGERKRFRGKEEMRSSFKLENGTEQESFFYYIIDATRVAHLHIHVL